MAADRTTGRSFATRSEVIARHGMAATSQPLATQVAIDVLKRGGTAVDAAIAANACLGLMEPTGCGIGGDLFAIVWDAKTQRLHGLNGSGRAPAGMTIDELRRRGIEKIPKYGPLPVTVPGCVDGWYTLHGKFGKLPMKELLAPAIQYAEEGFPLSEIIADDWGRGAETYRQYPGFAEIYLPGGHAPRKGEVFRNPRLAATLQSIAEGGPDVYYRGPIAAAIEQVVQSQGGLMTAKDLAAHHSDWVDPVSVDYHGVTVWELPPNGQGIAALQMLNLLEPFPMAGFGFGSPDHLHHLIEAKKLAFEDRARYYADPALAKVPVKGLISKSYADERRRLIDAKHAASGVTSGVGVLEHGDTIYLTVADSQRNMVSLIQSNYRGFGSGMCPAGLGFCLQNRGEMFSLDREHANRLEPGKRPFHTIIPAFITRDGKPWVSFGVMGGATQPQAHVQIVLNLVDFGMNLQEAGDAPRMVHMGSSEPTGEVMADSGQVQLESGIEYEAVRELMARGHRVEWSRGNFGGYQAILYDADQDVYYGASESRKDGQAAGY